MKNGISICVYFLTKRGRWQIHAYMVLQLQFSTFNTRVQYFKMNFCQKIVFSFTWLTWRQASRDFRPILRSFHWVPNVILHFFPCEKLWRSMSEFIVLLVIFWPSLSSSDFYCSAHYWHNYRLLLIFIFLRLLVIRWLTFLGFD